MPQPSSPHVARARTCMCMYMQLRRVRSPYAKHHYVVLRCTVLRLPRPSAHRVRSRPFARLAPRLAQLARPAECGSDRADPRRIEPLPRLDGARGSVRRAVAVVCLGALLGQKHPARIACRGVKRCALESRVCRAPRRCAECGEECGSSEPQAEAHRLSTAAGLERSHLWKVRGRFGEGSGLRAWSDPTE